MPIDYVIDAARRIVLTKATGILTAAEVRDRQQRLLTDPAFQADFRQFADFAEATEFRTTAEDIRHLAENSPFRAGSKRAFVVPRPNFYGLARMFQTLTEEHRAELRIFYDAAEAMSWLELKS